LISIAKSDDDKKKLQDYIQQKREHEEMFSNENRLKDEQERIRRDKLKKLNEQIKETPHQYLPSSSTKRTSAFTPVRFIFFKFSLLFLLLPFKDNTKRIN
jgi:hypothetical protein